MANFIWAFDDGYGDNKLFNGKEEIIIPSHCTSWRKRMRSELNADQIDPLSYVGVEVDTAKGEKYLIGQGALEQSYSLNWTGGENKHKDFNFPIIAKACLGILSGRVNKATVEPLVMGLPVDADESDERHTLLEELMVGTHKLKLHTADEKVVNKEVKITKLITKKQPFGSFCDLILDSRGDITRKDMARQFNVIVDIGTRTLNIYTLDSLDPVTELCVTRNQGVYTAYEKVGHFIKDELKYNISSGSIVNIVRRGEVKGVDLAPVVDRSYSYLANEVFKIVDTLLVNSWAMVDNLIITGGGSEPEVLQPHLQEVFPIEPQFLDRTATVRGLWKYGVRSALQGKEKITIAMPTGGSKTLVAKVKK